MRIACARGDESRVLYDGIGKLRRQPCRFRRERRAALFTRCGDHVGSNDHTQRAGSTRVEHTARARGGAGGTASVLAFLMEGVPEHLRGAVTQVAESLAGAGAATVPETAQDRRSPGGARPPDIHLHSNARSEAPMSSMDREDTATYTVVVNDEEQYSIWPADRAVPLGWQAVGKTGTKAECLEHVETVWTDMRPRSLREKMAAAGL
jgi:MbtH protein